MATKVWGLGLLATSMTLVTSACVIGGRPNAEDPSINPIETDDGSNGGGGGGGNGAQSWGTPGGSDYILTTGAVKGTKMYVGGYSNYFGKPNAEGLVILDPATGEKPAGVNWPNFYYTLPGAPSTNDFKFTTGTIYAIVADPNEAGAFFVGGEFSHVDGIPQANLARIKPDGSLDPSWTTTADDIVYALTTDGTSLYVAGKFAGLTDTIGTHGSLRVAKVNATTGVIQTAFTSSVWGAQARAIALFPGGKVALGGNLWGCGMACQHYMVLNGTTGATTADGGVGADNEVNALVTDGTAMYAAGEFANFMGAANTRIAAVDAANPSSLLGGFSASANDVVHALAVDATGVYLAGEFSQVNGAPKPSIAKISKTLGSTDTDWEPIVSSAMNGDNPPMTAIHASGLKVYLGGAMNKVNGAWVSNGGGVNSYDGITNVGINLNFRTTGMMNQVGVMAYAESGGNLIVGGSISSHGGEARLGLAQIDLETGAPTSWKPVMDMPIVLKLAIHDDTLYVVGQFSTVDGSARPGVAAFDISGATPVLTAWNPAPLVGGGIMDLEVNSTAVYLTGGFTSIGGSARAGLAAFDHGSNTPNAWAPTTDGSLQGLFMNSMKAYDDTIYIWGTFSQVNGADARAGLAAVDATTGATQAWNPDVAGGAGAIIGAVTRVGTSVLVGGSFTTINGGTARARLAATHATTGADLAWAPAPDDDVLTITLLDDTFFVGGEFTSISGSARKGVARYNTADRSLASWSSPLLMMFTMGALVADGDPDESIYFISGAWGDSLNGAQPSMNCGITRLKNSDGSLMLPE